MRATRRENALERIKSEMPEFCTIVASARHAAADSKSPDSVIAALRSFLCILVDAPLERIEPHPAQRSGLERALFTTDAYAASCVSELGRQTQTIRAATQALRAAAEEMEREKERTLGLYESTLRQMRELAGCGELPPAAIIDALRDIDAECKAAQNAPKKTKAPFDENDTATVASSTAASSAASNVAVASPAAAAAVPPRPLSAFAPVRPRGRPRLRRARNIQARRRRRRSPRLSRAAGAEYNSASELSDTETETDETTLPPADAAADDSDDSASELRALFRARVAGPGDTREPSVAIAAASFAIAADDDDDESSGTSGSD